MFQNKMRISLSELQEQIQEDLLTYFDGADCDIQFEVCAIVCANFRNFADKYDLKESPCDSPTKWHKGAREWLPSVAIMTSVRNIKPL